MNAWKKKIAALVCFAIALPLAACGKQGSAEAQKIVVKDAEAAVVQLAELGTDNGYENALSELTEKSTATIDGDSYYRLQQNYQGIPVYGRTVVCATDEKGNVTSVTGNVMDIDPDLDLTPTVTELEVHESIRAYMTEEMGLGDVDDLQIEPFSKKNLCIYSMDGAEEHLAYCLRVDNCVLIVSAHNGDVLFADSNVMTESMKIEYTAENRRINSLEIEETSEEYVLVDHQHRIRIYDANGSKMYNSGTMQEGGVMLVHFWSENGIDTVKSGNNRAETFDSKAIKLYTGIRLCYEFYQDTLGLDGVGENIYIDGFINDQFDNKPNGHCISYSDFPAQVDLLGFTEQSSLTPDVVGHEYTHAVEQRANGLIYESDSGAIMEAMSDIFGELIEGWSKEDNPDWKNEWRNMRDPASNGYPVKPSDPNKDGQDYCHGYSTVISHAAYLMWNGIDGTENKKISADDLAKLWYRAMLMMPADCDFVTCRKMVEYAAESMENLTKTQRDCIGEAFDHVSIERPAMSDAMSEDYDYHLTKNSKIQVLNVDGDPCSDYALSITGEIMQSIDQGVAKEKKLYSTVERLADAGERTYQKSWKVESTDPFALMLPSGIYTITITDGFSSDSYEFTVCVSESGTDDSIVLFTDFKPPLIVQLPGLSVTREIKTGWNLMKYQLLLQRLESIMPDKLEWDIVDLDEDDTLELYAYFYAYSLRDEMVAPAHLFMDPDMDKLWIYYNFTPLTYTELCDTEDFGLCLTDHYGKVEYESFYNSTYYRYDGTSWMQVADLSAMFSESDNGWISHHDLYWGTETLSVEDFLVKEKQSVTEFTPTSPVWGPVRIDGNHSSILAQLDELLSAEATLAESIQVDFDNDMVFEQLYLLQGVADNLITTYEEFGESWFEAYEDILLDQCGNSMTAVLAERTDEGVLLRMFDLGPGSVRSFDVVEGGILFGGKMYTYNSVDALFTCTGEVQKNDNLVVDAFSDYGIRDDGRVNNYRIPKLNLSGPEAEKTNAVIYRDLYDGAYKSIRNKSGACFASGITYTWTENNGVVSILAAWMPENVTGHGRICYEIYNASAETGSLLSTEQVVKAYGLSMEEFYALAKEKVENKYRQMNQGLENADWAKANYAEYLQKAISDSNIKKMIPFISESGDLCVITELYYVGVMQYHTQLINVTGNTDPQTPQFSWEMPDGVQTDANEWKKLYVDYIDKNYSELSSLFYSYTIAYVDGDDIPEIFLVSESAMPGAAILWIADGAVKVEYEIGYGDIHYYEKEGLVCTSWMNHGNYADAVYNLRDGEFTRIHMGRISEDGSCDWDNQSVTRAEYDSYLMAVFDRSAAREINYNAPISGLLEAVRSWE